MKNPRLSIIMATWNSEKWLPACFDALTAQTNQDFECIVVDNASSDGSLEWIQRNVPSAIIIPLEHNTGFAHAMNVGINQSQAPYILTLNTDTIAEPDFIETLLNRIEKEPGSTGVIASCMLDYENPSLIENAGDRLTWYGEALKRGRGNPAADYQTSEYIFSACAGAALYRKSMLDEIGLFDETFFAYLEDIDLGLRAQIRGYKCLYEPAAKVLHQGHGSDLPGDNYVQWITRNRLQLFFKNVPTSLLLKRSILLIFGQVVCMAVYRRNFLSWFKGVGEGLRSFRPCRAHAASLWKKHSALTPRELDVLITTTSIIRRSKP